MSLPIDSQLQTFESMICPILLYESEVYQFENCSMIESIY